MKSILISIQPKWCELIASGKKTIEVRKTRPKLDIPLFKDRRCGVMKKFFDFIKLTLCRVFINPCYRCVREGNCAIYNKHGYCGDCGFCCYEERSDT